MDSGEADCGVDGPGEQGTEGGGRRVAPGQIWIACALCRRAVELSDSVDTVEGHVCPDCAVGL